MTAIPAITTVPITIAAFTIGVTSGLFAAAMYTWHLENTGQLKYVESRPRPSKAEGGSHTIPSKGGA